MSGTKEGGVKCAATNKAKYGSDYYSRIGAMGGKIGHTGGFATPKLCTKEDCEYRLVEPMHLVAQCSGRRGGRISRRWKKVE